MVSLNFITSLTNTDQYLLPRHISGFITLVMIRVTSLCPEALTYFRDYLPVTIRVISLCPEASAFDSSSGLWKFLTNSILKDARFLA